MPYKLRVNNPIGRDLHITLTSAEIEEHTGMSGCHVADVDVDNGDGTYSRFYLSVRINKRGQPVFEVATAYASDKVVSKSVIGARRKLDWAELDNVARPLNKIP